MSLLKVVMQHLGKMVCLFTTPSMGQTELQQRNANKSPVPSGLQTQDAQEQSQPVQSKPKRKPKAVQLTIVEASPKRTRKLAPKDNGRDGLLLQTPVLQTRLPVKPAVKAKAARVPSIKAALLSQLEQAVVQTRTEVLSGERGKLKTRASKTRPAAKAAPTKKAKAVVSTTPAKKSTKSKTPAQTRTVRQSKAAGR